MSGQSEIQLYLPTTLTTKVALRARDINPYLNQNIQQAVEDKFGNKFFSFGHVRPGTIKVIKKSIGNKLGTSDFKGDMHFKVKFQCEVYLPQIGQEIEARVKSINKIGILAKSDNNKITLLLSKPHQTNLELFSEIMLETRIRAKIIDFKIDNQNETIVVFGDLTQIIEGIYQNYQLPRIDGVHTEIRGDLQPTSDIHAIYTNYGNFIESVNSKSLMDPYAMFKPKEMDPRDWINLQKKKNWSSFKNYWMTAKSMVEDYELVFPPRGYNKGQGVAVIPFKSKPISRAYFKMWELLHRYPDIMSRIDTTNSDLRILALCEGPGGFIQSIAHYGQKYGIATNSMYSYNCYTLETNKLKHPNLRWDWPQAKTELEKLKKAGIDLNLDYGDMTRSETLKKILADMKGQKADLVVADGAIENINVYNYEEVVNYKLFFGEIAAALLNQKIGGNFVLKIFDILTHVTRQYLLLLNHYYSEVFITKPDFSRPASSEKYVVCLGFRGITTPSQTEEDVQETLFELMDVWQKKIVENLEIYYPKNETFLLRLLGYNLGEEDEFSKKIHEISEDHIQKQSEHISKGVHLIHTKALLNDRKVEQLKNNQLRKAVQWCQKYKLEYKEDVQFSKDSVVESEIINVSETLGFVLGSVDKDHKETYDYLKTEYPYLSLEYLQERVVALQFRLEPIIGEYLTNEVYRFKAGFLEPTGYLNDQLGENYSPGWYSIYELLSNEKIASKRSKYSFLVNADTFNADATRAVHDYLTKGLKMSEKDLEWYACLDYNKHLVNGEVPDPSGWLNEHKDKWLMGANEEGKTDQDLTDGNLTNIETINWFANRFIKNKVDLYVGDLRIPVGDRVVEGFTIDPETVNSRELLAQHMIGLMSLKDGGEMICRQYSFFNDLTVQLLTLLDDLFESVAVVKPLVSPAESPDLYVVCKNFQSKKFTDAMMKELVELFEDMPSRSELEDDPDMNLPTMGNKLADPKKVEIMREKLTYIGYRIYVLNHMPKVQINLDLFENPHYALSSQQESSLMHLLGDKQELIQKEDLSGEDQSELNKIDQQIDEIFSEVAKRIIEEDFRYIIDGIVTNWLDLYAPKK